MVTTRKSDGIPSELQIGGFEDASQGTVFEGRAGKKPKVTSAELQDKSQALHELTAHKNAATATGALKTYEFPSTEEDLFIDGTEGEYDPVMAALQNGALPDFDPIDEAVKTSTVSLADLYDTPLSDLSDEEFSSAGFMALGDIANQRTKNSLS